MKVFISWSGERSRAVAEILRQWLPSVLQAVRPYFTPDDIVKGARWNSEISRELDASRIGLLVLTPENQNAPWLVFEAGALGKNLDRSKVCPILLGGLEPSDVKGPLVQFQAARFDRVDMKRLVKMMNSELGEAALVPHVLESVFCKWWPDLHKQVNAQLEKHQPNADSAPRSERDILEEVLALTRAMTSERDMQSEPLPLYEVLMSSVDLLEGLSISTLDKEMLKLVRPFVRALNELAGPLRGAHMRHVCMELGRIEEELLNARAPRPLRPTEPPGQCRRRRQASRSTRGTGLRR
ncbi:MAG: toll/interleukin-1 receptor domain-containing protein [Acidobacteriota bacterium]